MAKSDDVTCERRSLHNRQLYDLYYSPSMTASRRIKWTGHVGHMRDRRDAYRVFMRRSDGKRPF